MSSTDDCLIRNAAYEPEVAADEQPASPRLALAIVTCMDARIETGRLLGLREGDAHVIRNAGGLVTDDVIRSLTLSQRLLGTREVMLIQHTECGLHGLDEAAVRAEIEAESGAPPPFALGSFESVEVQVRRSLETLRTSPFLPHRDRVRGFVYDVREARLREVT